MDLVHNMIIKLHLQLIQVHTLSFSSLLNTQHASFLSCLSADCQVISQLCLDQVVLVQKCITAGLNKESTIFNIAFRTDKTIANVALLLEKV